MKRLAIAGLIASALVGCATDTTPYPADPAQQARYHADQARQEFARGELQNGLIDVSHALSRPGGAAAVGSLLATDPAARGKLIDAVNEKIDAIASLDNAKTCDALLTRLAEQRIVAPDVSAAFDARYVAAVRNANERGRIAVLLGPEADALSPLSDKRQMRIVFDRTLAAYRDKSFARRDMEAVIAYLQSGADPSALAEFRKQLPALNVRNSELPLVAQIDPVYVKGKKAGMSMKAHLRLKNIDRLFADDVVTQLSLTVRGVNWIQSREPDVLEVVVERVLDDERRLPRRFRTVTYGRDQVDYKDAITYMPPYSLYQFDLTSGGSELHYGYVVSAWKNGARVAESVVRGKLGGAFQKCENARIVSDMNGIVPANFTANDDMRRACGGEAEVTIESLRRQLLTKISTAITALPGISAVDSQNL